LFSNRICKQSTRSSGKNLKLEGEAKMEQNYKKRTRVNFSVSVKGVVTPDCTIEILDSDNETVIKEATALLDAALIEAQKRSKGE